MQPLMVREALQNIQGCPLDSKGIGAFIYTIINTVFLPEPPTKFLKQNNTKGNIGHMPLVYICVLIFLHTTYVFLHICYNNAHGSYSPDRL